MLWDVQGHRAKAIEYTRIAEAATSREKRDHFMRMAQSSLLLAKNRALFLFGATAVLGEVACLTAAVVALPALLVALRRRNHALVSGGDLVRKDAHEPPDSPGAPPVDGARVRRGDAPAPGSSSASSSADH